MEIQRQASLDVAPAGLRPGIRLSHAVALYVSSVLGSGVLVLPGLAAQVAGPASLVAWILLGIASVPFAFTFASLSIRKPESGGVYAFAREAFGRPAAGAVGWLFALWHVTGAPAVTLIAASYLSFAFPLDRWTVDLVAFAVILVPYLINMRGIVMSARIQLAVVGAIFVLLAAAVIVSAGSVRASELSPFAPKGWLPVGTAAALIFWSFLGYENVSNVAEEFRDPRRDLRRSVLISVFVIGVLYLLVAVVTVGTGAWRAGGSVAPFASIFSRVFGPSGAAATAVLALGIIFGTVNAYTTGLSRVVLAVARDGLLPRAFMRVSPRTGAPTGSLTLLTGMSLAMLLAFAILNVDLKTALLVPGGAAILVYVIGSASGIRLLSGGRRLMAWISLVLSLAVLPFVGREALAGLVTAGVAFLAARRPRSRGGEPPAADSPAARPDHRP